MNFNRPIILASNSPRRRQILADAGFTFTVVAKNISEDYPLDLPPETVPIYLARKKAAAFEAQVKDEIVIAADTVVILEGNILEKPVDVVDAFQMLTRLSGKKHKVVTGICLFSKDKEVFFSELTEVTFAPLSTEEIEFYIHTYKPFDKAGSYGIQEWLGMIGVSSIAGSFYNVMGLPIHQVYTALHDF